ncbi:MAG TPA: endolytic transglycosylase MltG [bacterium]|nr:endolytic transglycosylase MltG [bacterium]
MRAKFGLLVVLLLLALAAAGGMTYRAYQAELFRASAAAPGTLTIPPGATAGRVAALLVANGVGSSARLLTLYMDVSGQAGKLQAGTYRIPPKVVPAEMIARIARGEAYTATICLPEGLARREIGQRLQVEALCTADEFVRATAEQERVLRLAGEAHPHLEGYLFPATYDFAPGSKLEEIVAAMVKRFRAELAEVERGGTTIPQHSFYERLIVASIVEKEAKRADERARVAAVFYNRLANRRRLESCATVLYALGMHKNALSLRDLDVASPYNTYRHDGLPPTPICNPGRASLEAAWRPAAEQYLYFVAKGDGSHAFSYTLEEHNRMIRQYQP